MAVNRWHRWELAGLFVTLILGNLLHFAYEWSGGSSVVAAFAAVNESTWEHMKLLVVPWTVWSLVEAVALRGSRRPVLPARAVGLLAGVAAIPVVYYTYTGALGVSSMIVDVLLFQAAVLLGAWISWRIMKRQVYELYIVGVWPADPAGYMGAVCMVDLRSAAATAVYGSCHRADGYPAGGRIVKETAIAVSFS